MILSRPIRLFTQEVKPAADKVYYAKAVSNLSRTDQSETPLFSAVKKYISKEVVPFHVPGHKQGKGLAELKEFLGETALKIDLNGMPELDFATNPTGVIKEAEQLFAQAFGADSAFFLVNGTTSGVQTMLMSVCNPGDQVIVPRNAHKSTINGLILSGALPVYLQPEINQELGLVTGVTLENIKKAIKDHPRAKAILVLNPSYYGITGDLKVLVHLAHQSKMAVLADEAHGTHFHCHEELPLSAMAAGADFTAISMHKTGGSLTQSAALLVKGNRVKPEEVRTILNLTYTTSASYLLLCSLDVARKQLAVKGRELMERLLQLARWTRSEVNKIEGLRSFGRELIGTPGIYDLDETKVTISAANLGLTGYEMEDLLRRDYRIQVELSDLYNVLPYIGVGDSDTSLGFLISALKDIALNYTAKSKSRIKQRLVLPPTPKMVVPPREAFYSPQKSVRLNLAEGEIAGEMVMAYPPGIPVICLGEKITKEIIDYIKLLKTERCVLQGPADPTIETLRVLGVE